MLKDGRNNKAHAEANDANRVRVVTILKRVLPVLFLVLGLIMFFALDLDKYVNLEMLAENRRWLIELKTEHPILSVLGFILIYTAMVSFSIPGAVVMSVTGGFLFGQWFGLLYNVCAATVGATILFKVANWSIGETLRKRAGHWLIRMEGGFKKNAFSYLLVLRLVPIIPFWAVNLAAALLGLRLSTFIIATFFGIIPGGFVFTTFGSGIGGVLDLGKEISVSAILTPQIVTALIGLAGLALLPGIYRKFKHRV